MNSVAKFVSTLKAKLRLAAYEALMELIKNSPRDCYTTVQKTMIIILERMNQVLAMNGQVLTHVDRAEMVDVQGLLCATLQVLYNTIGAWCNSCAIFILRDYSECFE